jgi:hypothetical protein
LGLLLSENKKTGEGEYLHVHSSGEKRVATTEQATLAAHNGKGQWKKRISNKY